MKVHIQQFEFAKYELYLNLLINFYIKVLGVDHESPLLYKETLSQKELVELFKKNTDLSDISAKREVCEAYRKSHGIKEVEEEEKEEIPEKDMKVKKKKEEGAVDQDCPICFEIVHTDGSK